jgi:predicted enzyme related to lactoylglutathione lyase
LNLNGLNTRDVEGAKSFYGSVFGWRTLALDAGPEMWTVHGFGDFLERDNPDLRKQMAEAGAPKGFEDVVASINPIADDQPDTPAHWSVTFAVDDADATAAKAAERGGKVIVPPFDAPWVRITVIGDPQRAMFIASKFVPENKDLGSQTDAAFGDGWEKRQPRSKPSRARPPTRAVAFRSSLPATPTHALGSDDEQPSRMSRRRFRIRVKAAASWQSPAAGPT